MRKAVLFLVMSVLVLTSSKPVKVACIGDSITYGATIEDRARYSYPSVLQQMMGPQYEVRNFGFSARTMLDSGDHPYMSEKMYQEVKEFMPDIVTIMLGTNDSKPHNWAGKDGLEKDCKRMISELQNLHSHPRIYICLPPAVYKDNFGITDSVILNEVTPILKKAAADKWLDVIDTRPTLLGQGDKFSPDGVHPNATGAAALAETIFAGLAYRGDTGTPGKRVVFIGDSITDDDWGKKDGHPTHNRSHYDMNHIYGHGFVLNCAQHYQLKYPAKGYKFYNRGISGDTLKGICSRYEDDVLTVHPDVVSVLVGINDTWDKTIDSFDFKAWEERLRWMVETTLAFDKDIKMILCTPFISDMGAQKLRGDYERRLPIVQREAEIVRGVAAEYGLTCIDYQKLFEKLIATNKSGDEKYWMWDGIHPTMVGHQKMAELWIKTAQKAKLM